MEARIKLISKYKPLYQNTSRYYILTSGRGAGKSFHVADFLLKLTYEKGHTVLFARFTMSSASISIIPEFTDKIDRYQINDVFTVNKTDIENKYTGTKILFRGIKTSSGIQTAALKSLQGITTWVVDEAEELTDEGTFDKIDLSVRQKGIQNRVILVMNPATKEHWIYKRFFESRGIETGFNGVVTDTTYIHTDYRDNIDNLDESFLRQIENIRVTNPDKYRHVILGGWLDKMEGVIVSNWKFGAFDESLPAIHGLDFGYSIDPTALVRVAIKGKTIYAKEILYEKGLTTDKLALRMSDVKGLIIGDNAEPRMIAELQDRKFNVRPCVKGQDSVRQGILKILEYELIIEGENLAKELNNYTWSDKKSNTPNDAYNHLIDALRYAVTYQLEQGGKRLKVSSWGNLGQDIFA